MAHFRKISIIFSIVTLSIFALNACATKNLSQEDSGEYWPTEEWRTSSPEDQNMDSNQLVKMNTIIDNDYPEVKSVIVIRNGFIVFEKYYIGDANTDQSLHSATKAIVSSLIGIALDKGYIDNTEQKAISFFPEYEGKVKDDRFNDISIKNLLTMSAGFDVSPFVGRKMKRCINYPITTPPGTEAHYNSCSTHLLSGIISKSTKMSALEFGYTQLFKPIGIEKPYWKKDSDGYNLGGYGLKMRSRDMAKIGYLYLNEGLWDGVQIISKDWIQESTKEQNRIKVDKEIPCGYQWWVGSHKGYACFYAMGFGGQFISVYPDLKMVTVITSGEKAFNTTHQDVVSSNSITSIIQ